MGTVTIFWLSSGTILVSPFAGYRLCDGSCVSRVAFSMFAASAVPFDCGSRCWIESIAGGLGSQGVKGEGRAMGAVGCGWHSFCAFQGNVLWASSRRRLRIAPPDRRGGRGKGGASRDGALYGRLSLLLLSIAHKGLRTMGRIVPALAALRAGLFSDALTGSQQILRGQPKTPPITDRTPGNRI